MISLKDAWTTVNAFKNLADSPVRQVRYEAQRRGTEWKRVAEDLEKLDDTEWAIETAGAVVPGMRVLVADHDGDHPCAVLRQMEQRGQFTLHVRGPDGRDIYINHFGPSSPVIVRA